MNEPDVLEIKLERFNLALRHSEKIGAFKILGSLLTNRYFCSQLIELGICSERDIIFILKRVCETSEYKRKDEASDSMRWELLALEFIRNIMPLDRALVTIDSLKLAFPENTKGLPDFIWKNIS